MAPAPVSGTSAATSPAPATGVRFAVTAYRWSDGGRAWQHESPAEGPLIAVHDKHNLSTPSPVTDGQIVIGWFGTGQVVALDAATGKPVWAKHLGKEYGAFEINWGHASSATMHGELAIFPCYHETGSYLVALDKRTGAVRWKRDREPGAHSYSTPLVVTHDGRSTLVLNSSRGVEGVRSGNGRTAVASPRRQSLSDPDASPPSGRALHEPRVPQQPVSRDSARRPRRCEQQPRRVENTDGCALCFVARVFRRAALHGERDGHRQRARSGDRAVGLARACRRRLHCVARWQATARSISPARAGEVSSCALDASPTSSRATSSTPTSWRRRPSRAGDCFLRGDDELIAVGK